MKFSSTLLLLAVLVNFSSSFKVISFVPFESKSHFAIGNSISKSLLKGGHDVTVVCPYPQKVPEDAYRKITYVNIEGVIAEFKKRKLRKKQN